MTGGNEFETKLVSEVGETLGFDESSSEDIVTYLCGEGLVARSSFGGNITITHYGITGVEEALSEPDKPTEYVLPVSVTSIRESKVYEPQWLDSIEDGSNRIFGFLQFDIQDHSRISESVEDSKMQEIKSRLQSMATWTARLYDGWELAFSGDGAVYIFYPEQGSATDQIVKAGLHILHELSFFNDMLQIDDLLSESLILRLSCHRGEATFHRSNPGLIHSKAMNRFLKNEREIGLPNSIRGSRTVAAISP